VFLGINLGDSELAYIQDAVHEARIIYFGGERSKALENSIDQAEVIAANTLSGEAIQRAPQLRWVHSWAAGLDELLTPELIESPVVVTSSAGSGAIGIAEHAVMLMLMLVNRAVDLIAAQSEHRWVRSKHAELHGKTCGIIGLGHAGRELARRLRPFGMRVIGLRREGTALPECEAVYTRTQLDDFLGQSDFVVVTAALTSKTINLLGEAEFRSMKSTAFYICSSRGAISNEVALTRALSEGWIAGAGLDAFADEPLPADSALWSTPNTIVTPHIGAFTQQRMRHSIDLFVTNLQRYIDGKNLLNVANKFEGY
jgi:phosphoglycerate dehydrogenase-like enzyme